MESEKTHIRAIQICKILANYENDAAPTYWSTNDYS